MEIIKLVWRYIVGPIVEAVVEQGFLYLFLSLSFYTSKWFLIPAIVLFLGIAMNYSVARMERDKDE